MSVVEVGGAAGCPEGTARDDRPRIVTHDDGPLALTFTRAGASRRVEYCTSAGSIIIDGMRNRMRPLMRPQWAYYYCIRHDAA